MLHSISWVVWTAAVAVSATLTQNPFYLMILLGVAITSSFACLRAGP
jgi:hypothetical protein